MKIDFNSTKPIFMQIADGLCESVLLGGIPEEEQIPSITELSVELKVNPATALKGVNILVSDGIVYKKRGLGMFVAKNATAKIMEKRKGEFMEEYVVKLLSEAEKLGITKEEIVKMIEGAEIK